MTIPKDLRAKAEAATRGPWTHEIEGDAVIIMAYDDCEYHEIAKLESNRSCRELDDDEDNAAYIAAASPDVVISLLDEIERLREYFDASEDVRKHGLLAAGKKRISRLQSARAALTTGDRP